MATVPHALRGWWRYSRLAFIRFGSNVVVTLCLWVVALDSEATFAVVLAVAITVLLLTLFVYGAVNAERARRYGCW